MTYTIMEYEGEGMGKEWAQAIKTGANKAETTDDTDCKAESGIKVERGVSGCRIGKSIVIIHIQFRRQPRSTSKAVATSATF
jgi:hypothetical protein